MPKQLLLICLIMFSLKNYSQFHQAIAPVAQKKEHLRTIHEDSVTDHYYWMYDYFGKGPDSSQVISYLNEENKYLDTVMSATKNLQAGLFSEMKARIKEKG